MHFIVNYNIFVWYIPLWPFCVYSLKMATCWPKHVAVICIWYKMSNELEKVFSLYYMLHRKCITLTLKFCLSAAFTARNFRSRNWKEKSLSKFEYIAHVSTGTLIIIIIVFVNDPKNCVIFKHQTVSWNDHCVFSGSLQYS